MIAPGTVEILPGVNGQTMARVRMTEGHGWLHCYIPRMHPHWCVMSVCFDGDKPRGINLQEWDQGPASGKTLGLTDEVCERLDQALEERTARRAA